jgi:hypothetical protein
VVVSRERESIGDEGIRRGWLMGINLWFVRKNVLMVFCMESDYREQYGSICFKKSTRKDF